MLNHIDKARYTTFVGVRTIRGMHRRELLQFCVKGPAVGRHEGCGRLRKAPKISFNRSDA